MNKEHPMRYAQFFTLSTGYVPGSIPPQFRADHVRPIEACGSDGVVYIDGRLGNERALLEARATCKARGFIGFTMNTGRSFSDSRVTRAFEGV